MRNHPVIAEAAISRRSPYQTRTEMELTGFIRIAEIEDKIGAGLIEEIIQVAEAENQLVDTILESRS